eukprot:4528776-Pleurochrysis_carterae.AAC.1
MANRPTLCCTSKQLNSGLRADAVSRVSARLVQHPVLGRLDKSSQLERAHDAEARLISSLALASRVQRSSN